MVESPLRGRVGISPNHPALRISLGIPSMQLMFHAIRLIRNSLLIRGKRSASGTALLGEGISEPTPPELGDSSDRALLARVGSMFGLGARTSGFGRTRRPACSIRHGDARVTSDRTR